MIRGWLNNIPTEMSLYVESFCAIVDTGSSTFVFVDDCDAVCGGLIGAGTNVCIKLRDECTVLAFYGQNPKKTSFINLAS